MEEYILDGHSSRCINSDNEPNWFNPHKVCAYNPERMLIYVNGKFVLLTFPSCLIETISNKFDSKAKFINQIIKKSKLVKRADTYRQPDIEKELRNWKYVNNSKVKLVTEINYIYQGAQIRHAVVSKVELIQSYLNKDEIFENFIKSKSYLNINYPNQPFLLDELEILHGYNSMLHMPSNAVLAHTIDQLIKNINGL